ncbi:MAG: hypothetical protein IT353_02150 [Gemmatimonadaceae bacterium]|nr:hypothetical protein [Gemmatimonadaceae bacterium]
MMLRIARPHWRRLTALAQLLLFAFSASTSLLPCEATGTVSGRPHHVAMSSAPVVHAHGQVADVAMADAHADHTMHRLVENDAALPLETSTTPAPPTAPCPLVVGCVGMMEWSVDVAIRTTESTIVVAAPLGDMLRHTTVIRDIASPPPRA